MGNLMGNSREETSPVSSSHLSPPPKGEGKWETGGREFPSGRESGKGNGKDDLTPEQIVDAFLSTRQRERSDNWQRDELLTLAGNFKGRGPKEVSRLLAKRSTRAVESMAERLGLKTDVRPGRRLGSTP